MYNTSSFHKTRCFCYHTSCKKPYNPTILYSLPASKLPLFFQALLVILQQYFLTINKNIRSSRQQRRNDPTGSTLHTLVYIILYVLVVIPLCVTQWINVVGSTSVTFDRSHVIYTREKCLTLHRFTIKDQLTKGNGNTRPKVINVTSALQPSYGKQNALPPAAVQIHKEFLIARIYNIIWGLRRQWGHILLKNKKTLSFLRIRILGSRREGGMKWMNWIVEELD